MNAVTLLKLPPNAPTISPATSGPKLVTTRAAARGEPDRGRTHMGREKLGQVDANPVNVPNTKKPKIGSTIG